MAGSSGPTLPERLEKPWESCAAGVAGPALGNGITLLILGLAKLDGSS